VDEARRVRSDAPHDRPEPRPSASTARCVGALHVPAIPLEPTSLRPGTPRVRVAAVGDLAFGPGVARQLQAQGPEYPFRNIRFLLADADLRFGNLEYPLTTSPRRHPIVRHGHECAPPEAVKALAHAGFDVLSVANNHIFDCLDDGLADSVSLLARHGIGCVGAGSSLAAARAPAVRVVNNMRLGFLAYTFPLHQIATENSCGCAPNDPEIMCEDVRCLKPHVDHIFVSIHAGPEFSTYPTVECQRDSRALLDEGATAVLHHHGHVPKGIEVYRERLIAYGLGNFLCDIHDPYFRSARCDLVDVGMILYLDLDPLGVVSFSVHPTRITPGLAVEPVDDALRESLTRFVDSISQPLYDTAALATLQVGRSIGAKVQRLILKARRNGLHKLFRELCADVTNAFVRQVWDGFRTWALHRELRKSPHHIEPNRPVLNHMTPEPPHVNPSTIGRLPASEPQ